jgi:hypothetical protein
MNKGDWLQLLIIIIVFLILGTIIYSLIMLPWWITLAEIAGVVLLGYFVNRRIKL